MTTTFIIKYKTPQGMQFLPAGFISTVANGFPVPDGWLKCDGQAVSIDEYPALFDALGYSFGSEQTLADGLFALPAYEGVIHPVPGGFDPFVGFAPSASVLEEEVLDTILRSN
jgi:microcystin-dependent protein